MPLLLKQYWYLWFPTGNLNQHLHGACQQKKAPGALRLPDWTLDLMKHWVPTGTEDMASCGNNILDLQQLGFFASVLFFQTLNFYIKCKIKFFLKAAVCNVCKNVAPYFLKSSLCHDSITWDGWSVWANNKLLRKLALAFIGCFLTTNQWMSLDGYITRDRRQGNLFFSPTDYVLHCHHIIKVLKKYVKKYIYISCKSYIPQL